MRKLDKAIIWPVYFDTTKTRKEGRRVPKNLAVQSPKIDEIKQAVDKLGLENEVNIEAHFPKNHWAKTGMILVEKREAKEKDINNIEAVIADLTDKIPLNDDSIDLCVMANVMHGFVENQEDEPVIKELSRVIKPGGAFAVVEFKKIEGPPGPPFDVRVAPHDLEDILTPYGFEAVEMDEVGDYHYLVKAVNKK